MADGVLLCRVINQPLTLWCVGKTCFLVMSLFRELCGTRTSTNVSSNTGSDGNPTQTSTVDRQHAPLFSPSTATPTSGTRRRRDSDNYDYGFEEDLIVARPAGTVPITPGTAKRLKMSCKAIAHAYDIEAAPLESFVEVC